MGRGFRIWDTESECYLPVSRGSNDGVLGVTINGTGVIYLEDGEANIQNNGVIIERDTGLKDKNGKRICEGDIVKAKIQGFWETGTNTITEGKATWNLEVIYNDIRYMDVFHILGSKNQPGRIYYLFEEAISDIEVVGNIHENPELLGGEE